MHLPWRDVSINNGLPISTSLTDNEIAELQHLARGIKVLEIGSAYGYSAVAMADSGGHVTAVDPHSWLPSLSVMKNNLQAYGVSSKVEVVVDTSINALADMAFKGRKFDLIFIDGDHSFQAVQKDVGSAFEVLSKGGILACHDYTESCCCPEVGPALDGLFPDGPTRLVDTLFVLET